jgi:chemotaxis protein MotB
MADEEECPKAGPADMGWLLTFADLISLLITFFVLLYSMKVVNIQKWDEIKGSFSGVFSIEEPIHELTPDKTTAIEKIDPIKADSLSYIEGILQRYFEKSSTLKNASIIREYEKERMIVSIPSLGIFKSQDKKMTISGEGELRELGDILRHIDNRIVVAVHTSNKIISNKKFPTNWELGMMRAITVTKILKKQGVTRPVTVRSYGKSRFDQVAPQLPLGKRQQMANRVEIILHSDESL